MNICPCGYVPDAGVAWFSHEYYVGHERHHHAVFADLDPRTCEILREMCGNSVDNNAETEFT